MAEPKSGLHFHITPKGKLMLVAQNNGNSVTFRLTIDEAKQLKNQIQSTVDQLEHEVSQQ